MTFTNELRKKSPVSKYLSWSGQDGKFTYWDKEKEEKVEVPTPFKFVVLDELSTIKGYHDPSQSGIYANEVRDTSKDILIVKAFEKQGEINSGLYRDIKGNLEGGKYAKSIYAYLDGEIVNISLTGASLSAWINADITKKTLAVRKNPEVQKKGSVEYYVPEFADRELNEKEFEEAKEAKAELDEYLDGKLGANVTKEEVSNDTEKEDLPQEAKSEPSKVEEPLNEEEDLPF